MPNVTELQVQFATSEDRCISLTKEVLIQKSDV